MQPPILHCILLINLYYFVEISFFPFAFKVRVFFLYIFCFVYFLHIDHDSSEMGNSQGGEYFSQALRVTISVRHLVIPLDIQPHIIV